MKRGETIEINSAFACPGSGRWWVRDLNGAWHRETSAHAALDGSSRGDEIFFQRNEATLAYWRRGLKNCQQLF